MDGILEALTNQGFPVKSLVAQVVLHGIFNEDV